MVVPVAIFQLECGINSYEWDPKHRPFSPLLFLGKLGSESAAAKLASGTTDVKIDKDKPYAELWMGTHPSLPSKDKETGTTLEEMVSRNEYYLAPAVVSRFGTGSLPFLFKVLSIGKALSIQAHPDKRLAERLHAEDPKNYPDDNHKPEMTIAITPFTGFCGFRPLGEISAFLTNVPSLKTLLGGEVIEKFEKAASSEDEKTQKQGLKSLFETLMNSNSETLEKAAKQLLDAAQKDKENFAGGEKHTGGKKLADLILNVNRDFPNDIGLFCSFLLNYVELQPGEGMFLRANDPHAYLSGDVIECMATSDNVVRAGFTPKFKDVKTLVSMLTYTTAPPSAQKMNPTPYPYKVPESHGDGKTVSESLLYNPPIEEFAVIRTTVEKGAVQFTGIFGPSIIIFTKCEGEGYVRGGSMGKKEIEVVPGTIVFVGAGVLVEIEGKGIECFRAFCSVEEKSDPML